MKRIPYFLLAVFLISACDSSGSNSSKDDSKQDVSYEVEVANREFSTEEWGVEDSLRIRYATGYEKNNSTDSYPEVNHNTEVVSGPNFSETESINLSLGNPDDELAISICVSVDLVGEDSHRISLAMEIPEGSIERTESKFDMGQTDQASVCLPSKESD